MNNPRPKQDRLRDLVEEVISGPDRRTFSERLDILRGAAHKAITEVRTELERQQLFLELMDFFALSGDTGEMSGEDIAPTEEAAAPVVKEPQTTETVTESVDELDEIDQDLDLEGDISYTDTPPEPPPLPKPPRASRSAKSKPSRKASTAKDKPSRKASQAKDKPSRKASQAKDKPKSPDGPIWGPLGKPRTWTQWRDQFSNCQNAKKLTMLCRLSHDIPRFDREAALELFDMEPSVAELLQLAVDEDPKNEVYNKPDLMRAIVAGKCHPKAREYTEEEETPKRASKRASKRPSKQKEKPSRKASQAKDKPPPKEDRPENVVDIERGPAIQASKPRRKSGKDIDKLVDKHQTERINRSTSRAAEKEAGKTFKEGRSGSKSGASKRG